MDIIIYAQSLSNETIGDLFYKDKYINKNENSIDLTDFFISIKMLNCLKDKDVEKVRAENTLKYLYLYIPCIEKDDAGRYSPIIIQAYHKDVGKIFDALYEFLDKSNRHISDESRKKIKEKIEFFKKNREQKIKNRKIAIGVGTFFAIVTIYLYMRNKKIK